MCTRLENRGSVFPVIHPGFTGKEILADTIQLDHQPMVTKIATTIASRSTEPGTLLATFRTCYHPRTNLGMVLRNV